MRDVWAQLSEGDPYPGRAPTSSDKRKADASKDPDDSLATASSGSGTQSSLKVVHLHKIQFYNI